MRVGIICPYDMSRPGGVQAQVTGLARALRERGDEVTVIAPGLTEGPGYIDLGGTVSVPGNGSMVPLSVNPRVGRLIEDAAGDLELLHVHEPFMPTVSVAALRVGKPVVATFHAAPSAIGVGLYSLAGERIGRLLGDGVRVVTAVSATAADALHESLAVRIIPNAVDVDSYAGDGGRVGSRVCFLGRDERRKGLDVLLDAWADVIEGRPDAELFVMGAKRDYPGIVWMGRVDDSTKVDVLSSAVVYVAPNLGGESFGITLIEAMAAGAAVLASDLTSFRDVAGDAGRFFEPGDSRELAAELISLLDDPESIAAMSDAGRKRAAAFDWSVVAAAYRSAYEEALS